MTRYAYDPYIPQQQTNTLGLAGFICSLLGLLTGGILSPVGLILSIAALGRQPRGFAVAGLILGILGTCGGVLLFLIFGAVILAALGIAAVALAYSEQNKLEITGDMATIAAAVEEYREEHSNYLPAGLDVLDIEPSRLKDPWGKPYIYEQKDPQNEFDLVSTGEDMKIGTEDDVRLSEIDKMWGKGGRINIGGRGKNGIVQIDLGGTGVDIEGEEEGGKVRVNVGGRTIEIKGDEDGERDSVQSTPVPPPARTPQADEQPAPSPPPSAVDEEDI